MTGRKAVVTTSYCNNLTVNQGRQTALVTVHKMRLYGKLVQRSLDFIGISAASGEARQLLFYGQLSPHSRRPRASPAAARGTLNVSSLYQPYPLP